MQSDLISYKDRITAITNWRSDHLTADQAESDYELAPALLKRVAGAAEALRRTWLRTPLPIRLFVWMRLAPEAWATVSDHVGPYL